MITVKSIGLFVASIVCFTIGIFIYPYGEQYQGMTGYVYDCGLIADFGSILLFLVGFILLLYLIIDSMEIPD
jgi:hypothetical protein